MMRKIHDLPTGYELNTEHGLWRVAGPEEGTNLILDPSFEGPTPTAPFTVQQLPAARVSGVTGVTKGKYAIQATTGQNGPLQFNAGISAFALKYGSTYTWSFDIYAPANQSIALEVYFWPNGINATLVADDAWVTTGAVERHNITFTIPNVAPAGPDKITLEVNSYLLAAPVMVVDAYMLEEKQYLSTYIDGDRPGCEWLGAPNASSSRRAANAPGGRIYNFKFDLGFAISAFTGHGMIPFDLLTDDLNKGGKRVNRVNKKEREIVLIGAVEANDLEPLQDYRQALTEALEPLADNGEPRYLTLLYQTYKDNLPVGKELAIKVIFAGGLPGSLETLTQERIALQFLEDTPVGFTEPNQNYQALSVVTTTVPAAPAYMYDKKGNISKIPLFNTGSGINAGPLAEALNNNVFIAEGSGTSYRVDYIGYDNTFKASSAVFNTDITAMLFLPKTNEVLVAGKFTGAGVGNGLAKVNTAGARTALLSAYTNLDGYIRALYTDYISGNYWIGGDFTNLGGAGGTRAAILDSNFAPLINLNANGSVNAIVSASPKVAKYSAYLAGTFTTIGPANTPANRIAKVTIAPANVVQVEALGTGLDGTVNALALAPDGSLIIGGSFSIAGGQVASRLARYDGNRFYPIGGGLNSTVRQLAVDAAGNIYVSGDFTGANDGTNLQYGMGIFDGVKWKPADYTSLGLEVTNGLYPTKNGRMALLTKNNSAVSPLAAGVNTIVNKGSAPAYPRLVFTPTGGTARVISIKNLTTGSTIEFDNTMINSGETITIDSGPLGLVVNSSYFGDIRPRVLPGSSLDAFTLAPGENTIVISANSADKLTAGSSISWFTTYQGVDGSTAG